MHSAVAAGAEHGEVLWLGGSDAPRDGDAVVGFNEVQTAVVVFWHACAGFAAELAGLGALAGKLFGQPGCIPVTFSSEVRPEDFAAFGVF